ncbi:glycoside hydrolase superfamily [Zopfochytrium polystomum]|nr:glycoside hydrolase superfamily [Zopfochytrium polystomum]
MLISRLVLFAIAMAAGAQAGGGGSSSTSNDATASLTLTVDPTKPSANFFQVHAMLETNLNDLSDGGLLDSQLNRHQIQPSSLPPQTTLTKPSIPPDELLVNHAFQDNKISQWVSVGGATLSYLATGGITAEIPCALSIASGGAGIGLQNPGWAGGIGILANRQYTTSFYVRSDTAQTVPVTVGVYDSAGNAAATYTFANANLTGAWQKLTATLVATTGTTRAGSWRVTFPSGLAGAGAQVAYTSLVLPGWNGQRLRADLAQAYADLRPAFIRLPGGNDLEGNNLAQRYYWNRTIGAPEHRVGRIGTWTGYNTETLGLHELLDFTESIGAQPVLAVFGGYSLDHTASPDFNAIAAEVVNELHYVTDASGAWAAQRAANGRAQPWTVTKVEIGNEDGLGTGPNTYQARFDAIAGAIRREFGPARFELISTWDGITGWNGTDIHDYNFPSFFRSNWRRYDSKARDGKIYYQDEIAVVNSGLGGTSEDIYGGPHRLKYPTLDAALSEAIFTLGLERNGDIVHGAAYAPGGGSVEHYQWTPNLINFGPGNATSRSTSYLTQQGFSLYPMTSNLNTATASTAPETSLVYHQIGKDASGKFLVRLVNYNSVATAYNVVFSGVTLTAAGSTKWVFNPTGITDLQSANTVPSPNTVTASTGALSSSEVSGSTLVLSLPAYSFVVISVKAA